MPTYPNDFLAGSNSSTSSTHAAKSAAAATAALKAIKDSRYVESLWVTIAFVIILLGFVRACKALLTIRRVNSPFVPPKSNPANYDLEEGSASSAIDYSRLPSAITSGFRIAAFRWSVWYGPRTTILMGEAAFITLYVALNLMWTFIDTRDLTITFWQGRSARIASSQIPLIVALSGRNNVISWLTSISPEKLNVLHRAAGRTCLILVWAHSAQHFVNGVPTLATTPWIIFGVISTVALTLLVILSIRPIRVHLHQFFFYSHIALALLTIVSGYIHVKEFDMGGYFWPALLIWALDRILRVINMWLNTRKSRSQSFASYDSTEKANTKATIQVLGSDTIRITMKRRMNWSAGQYAYICMPSISNSPAESHPFTIASISRTMDGSPPEQEKDLIFLVRGRGGFTKKLMARAEQGGFGSNGCQAQITAFIDGPYGHPPNLNQYTTCCLIAGGSGVSYTLPLLLDLVANAKLGLTQCRKILFVWAMRDPSHLEWIERVLSQALADAPKTLTIDARVYITGSMRGITALAGTSFGRVASVIIQKPPVSFLEVDLDEGGERRLSAAGTSMFGLGGYYGGTNVNAKRPHGLSGLNPLREKEAEVGDRTPRVRVEYKRPDVKELLESEVVSSHGTVSVDVAGPTGLTKTVRDALRGELCSPMAVLRGRAPVVLHTESFGG